MGEDPALGKNLSRSRTFLDPTVELPGLLLLLVGAAVARSLDQDEPLWHMVAESCSDVLRRAWFNSNDYPLDELRAAVREACNTLAIRNQLDLPQGKHRYWRTVQLQFGFSAKVSAGRLPYWLAGYSVPETIKALLSNDDLNRSKDFQVLWAFLSTWNRDQTNSDVESRVSPIRGIPAKRMDSSRKASQPAGSQVSSRRRDSRMKSPLVPFLEYHGSGLESFKSVWPPSFLHEVLASPAPVLTLYVEGMGMVRLVRDEHGGRTPKTDSFQHPPLKSSISRAGSVGQRTRRSTLSRALQLLARRL